MTGAEWALIVRLIPPAKREGSAWTVNLREMVNALLYVLGMGCQWRAIPKDRPPRRNRVPASRRRATRPHQVVLVARDRYRRHAALHTRVANRTRRGGRNPMIGGIAGGNWDRE